MNPPVAPQPVKEEKSNTWKWLLLGCFGFIVLGGGMAAFMGWQMYKGFSLKPAEVEAAAQKILPFEKPEGYEGKFSMNIMGVNMAGLAPQGKPESTGMIMLMTIPGGKNNRDALRNSMDRQNAGKDVNSQKLAPQAFKVRGENTPAEVQKFTRNQGAEASLQYSLYVTSAKGDLVLVNVTGPETTTTHDWVQKFLDTVK
jgi:hypothetical protein